MTNDTDNDLVCEVSEWIEGIRSWKKTIQIGIVKISFELRMDGHWGRDGEFVTRHRYCFFQTGTDNDGKFPKAEYFKVDDLDEAKKLADRYILGVVERGRQFLKEYGRPWPNSQSIEKPITKDTQQNIAVVVVGFNSEGKIIHRTEINSPNILLSWNEISDIALATQNMEHVIRVLIDVAV